VRFLQGTQDVLALVRTPASPDGGDSWLCIFNFSDAPVQVTLDDAPASSAVVLPGLPVHQVGERIDNDFRLPAYGIYWRAVSG
jgi:hypothetical protein